MLKHLSICAALVALGIGPLHAQEQEAFLQDIEVPGAGFDFVLAAPNPEAGALPDLGNMPDALVVHLYGGELVLVFDDAEKMLKALDSLKSPVGAFHVEGKAQPVALYIVPKVRGLPLGGEMMTLEEYEKFENQRWQALVPNPNDTAEITRAQASANLSSPISRAP
jgi:hypothetical protein